jgi:hypothetical protein
MIAMLTTTIAGTAIQEARVQLLSISNIAQITDEREARLPIERSMPAEIITSVIPIAGNPIIEMRANTLS